MGEVNVVKQMSQCGSHLNSLSYCERGLTPPW